MERFVIGAWALMLCSASVFAQVSVQLEGQPIAVKSPRFTARIEPDGCLTNLALGGIEFLAPGVSISRGSYFYQGGPLQLSEVEQLDDASVSASGHAAAVRYEFAETSQSWHLTNKTNQEMVFFVVFNGIVGAVSVDGAPLQETPLNGNYSQARFFAGTQVLEIEGFDKLWGPWQGPHQVVQTTLRALGSHTLRLRVSQTSDQERLQILDLKAGPAETDLTLTSPRAYQVIQRSEPQSGRVLVSGRTRSAASSVEIRLLGGHGLTAAMRQWQTVSLQPETRKFSTWLNVPAGGWYRLEARAVNQQTTLSKAAVDHFGVGEVFVGAGQSNSTNSGEFKTQQTSGMVSSFSGTEWQLADDPQPGVADRSQGGSFWPAFGDKMFQELGVPIGVATTGYGGTSVNQWQPDGDLFQRWLLARVHQLGPQGFRAVLWHQGESDVHMPSEEYFAKLKNIILTSTAHAGWEFPWFVAQASYHNPQNVRFESVRGAQQRLCDEGIALLGPDTDLLTGDHRDLEGQGVHFSPKGLKAHGELWAEKVLPYVKAQLAPSDTKSTPSK